MAQAVEKPKRKAWWVKKIDDLTEEVERLRKEKELGGELDKVSFAEGYFACMTKYQLLSKIQRRIIRDKLEREGPSYIRNFSWSSRRF